MKAGAAGAAMALGLLVAAPALTHVSSAHAEVARTPLPADRLHFGLGNNPADLTWFTNSGVPWRYRYAYLAGGINLGATTNGDPNCGANTSWQTWSSPA